MPNTFSQIYIQVVFAVKYRKAMIHQSWEDDLHKYITGIIQNKGQKLIAINGMPDHIHIFIGMKPSCNLSDLVREIKKASNSFINYKKLTASNFHWQEGFGAFSYSQSHIDYVVKYINNQKQHHTKQTFKDEYLDSLQKFAIEYDEKYLFEWIDK
jgi:REP element-mobilizing transposase RayT